LKAVRKKKNNIQRETNQNNSRFINGNIKSKRLWSEVFWALNENIFNHRIPYLAKLLLSMENKSLP
jgi:hypothetical protein